MDCLGIEAGRASNIIIDYPNVRTLTPYSNIYITSSSGNPITYFKNQLYTGSHLSSGFLLRITKHFICQGNISLRMNQFGSDPDSSNKNSTHFTYYIKFGAGLLLGYAF